MKKLSLSLLLAFFSIMVVAQFNKAKMDSLFAVLSAKDKGMGSIAIARNGQVIYAKAIGNAYINGQEKVPADIQTKYRIGSMTKMFTGVIIFQLIEEKKADAGNYIR